MDDQARIYLCDLKTFLRSKRVRRECGPLVVQMSLRLASAGLAREVLTLVEPAAEEEAFAPLVTGLRVHLGLEKTPDVVDAATREVVERLAGPPA